MKRNLLSMLLALLASGDTAAAGLNYGPWLQHAGSGTMTVMWEADQATGSFSIAYGLTPACELGSLTPTLDEPNGYPVYSVHLGGLSPDTIYHYCLRDGASDLFSATFKTAPASADREFRFYVAGDNRSNPGIWEAVTSRILADVQQYPQHNQTFLVNSGDIAADGSSHSDWDQYFPPARQLLARLPAYVSYGNHEDRTTSASDAFIYGYFDNPAAESGSSDEKWFALDYAGVHVSFLALYADAGFTSGSQYDWFAADLAAAAIDPGHHWLLAAMHFLPWSLGEHGESGAANQRTYLHPLMRDAGVVAAFGGHNHIYCRYLPIEGVSYITSGGAGAGLHTGSYSAWSGGTLAASAAAYHYLVVDVTPTVLAIRALDLDGNRIDWVTFGKDPANLPPLADAGPDRQGSLGQESTLDGTASVDPEGAQLQFRWTQLSGPQLGLTGADTARPSFTPELSGNYLFELRVSDGSVWSAPDFCLVQVTAGSLAFEPVADTYVDESNPDSNFGSADTLLVDNDPATYKTYLRFAVSGIEGEVLSARLELYCTDPGDPGQIVTSSDTSWSEDGPTWNNPLVEDGSTAGSLDASTTGWVSADVTPAVTGDGPLTLIIRPTGGGGADFHSRENSNPPRLVVSYSGQVVEPDGGGDGGDGGLPDGAAGDDAVDAGTADDAGPAGDAADAGADGRADGGSPTDAAAGSDDDGQDLQGSCGCSAGSDDSRQAWPLLLLLALAGLGLFRTGTRKRC